MNSFKKSIKFLTVAFLFVLTSLILFACVKTYKVTFDYNGGTYNNQSTSVVEVKKGQKIDPNAIPQPTKENFNFEGWLKGEQIIDLTTFTVTTSEIFTAKWKEKTVDEETFQVTVASEFANYFQFDNGFLVGAKVKKGTVATFTLKDLPTTKKLKTVLANDKPLTKNASDKYEVTLNENIELKLEWIEKDVKVTVANGIQNYIAFENGYTANTLLYKGETVSFKVVNLPENKELIKVTCGGIEITPTAGVYTVTVNQDIEINLELASKFKLTIDQDAKTYVKLVDYTEGTYVLNGTTVKFSLESDPNVTIKKVLANGNEITPTAEVYNVTLSADTVISLDLEYNNNELNEVKTEMDKVVAALENGLLKVDADTVDAVKTKVESIVDTGVVSVEVVKKETKKYTLTLKHTSDENTKLDRDIELYVATYYTITLPSSVAVDPVQTSYAENTTITLTVTAPEDHILKTLLVNGEDKTKQLVANKYTFNITQHTNVEVTFDLTDEFKNTIKAELNKVNEITIAAPTGTVNLDDLKTKVDLLVDGTIVITSVREDGGKYYLKVTSVKHSECFFEKEITIVIEQVDVTVNFGAHATYNGQNTYTFKVNKNSYLKETQLPKESDLVITSGYNLLGYADTDGGQVIVFGSEGILASDNKTFFAVLRNDAIKVKFVAEDCLDETTFNRDVYVTPGAQVADIGKPVRPGYKFKFWALSTDLNNFYAFSSPVNAPIELRAVFETTSYLDYQLLPSDEYMVSRLVDNSVAEIYIPQTHNNKKVVSIKHRTFHKANIDKLVILGEITEIGSWAFFESHIKEIDLGKHLVTIGDSTFQNSKLTSVVLPETIKYIGAYAFAGCNDLNDVTFKNPEFKAISYLQFKSSKFLLSLLTTSTNHLAIINNVIVAADSEVPNNLVIPNTVTHIGEGAFSTTAIPNSVSLEQLTFEANSQLVEIGNYAFEGRKLPTNLVIPKSVKQIGFRAFYGITNTKTVAFEDNSQLEVVRAEAFARTTDLRTYTLPQGFKAISKKQFDGARELANILNADGVVYVGEDALRGTKWYENNKTDTQGNTKKFITFNDTILLYDVNSTDTDEIPSTVKYIAPGAFYRPSRTKLVIPATVKEIYSGAFQGNGQLTAISISGYIEKIHELAFDFQSEFQDFVKTIVTIEDVDTKPETWVDNWNIVREYDQDLPNRIEFLWSPVCRVNFDTLGGVPSQPINKIEVAKGNTIILPNVTVTLAGKVFAGWELDGVRFTSQTTVTKSITLTAKYIDPNPDYEFRYENEAFVFVKLLNDSLTQFSIPQTIDNLNVVAVDADAFRDKTNLETVTLPAEIISLGDNAFNGAVKLATINYGTKLVGFGQDAFKATLFLQNIHNANSNLIINEVLVDAKMASGEVQFNGIKTIAGYAFAENTTLTKATFAPGLINILSYAFTNATALTEIVLPQGANYVWANAYAIGGTNTVKIDCRQVSYIAPLTWQAGYDNGNGATLNFVWEAVTIFSLTLPAEVTPTDPTVNVNAIRQGDSVELQVATKEYHDLVEFNVNNVNKISDVHENKITVLVDNHLIITVKYDLQAQHKTLFDREFNKLKDVMGFYNQRQHVIDSIKDTVSEIVDKDVVKVTEVSENGGTYNITLALDWVPTYTRTKTGVTFKNVGKLDSDRMLVTGKSSQVNYQEGADNIFDKYYASKWCDNSGIQQKFVTAKFKDNNPVFVSRFAITHAGFEENESFNTGEFKILVGKTDTDLHEVIHVVNNTASRTYHTFAGEEIVYIKLVVLHGENMDGGHVARVYELDIYGEDNNAIDIKYDYNGGNYKGDTESTIKQSRNTKIFEHDNPAITKEYHKFTGYKNQETNSWFNYPAKITNNLTLIAQWKLSPEVEQKLNIQFKKIKSINFVITDETELTEELVKVHVETLVDLDVVEVTATKKTKEVYKITLNIKDHQAWNKTKEFKFYPKKDGEKVNVTFDLAGGEHNGSTNNVVFQVEKGTKFPAAQLFSPTRNNYSFTFWRLDGNPVIVDDQILVGDTVFVADWEIDNQIQNAVDAEKTKLPNITGVVSSTTEFNETTIKAHLTTLIDQSVVTVSLESVNTNEYKVVLASVTEPTYSVQKNMQIYRLVSATLPACMQIVDPIKPGHLAIGYENKIVTNVSNGITVTITSVVGITNQNEYNKKNMHFVPEIQNDATEVKIEVSYLTDDNQVIEDLNKLVKDLQVSYSFQDPTAVTESDVLALVLNKNNLYGTIVTISDLGNQVFELTFTCVSKPTLFRKRKVMAITYSVLFDEPKPNQWAQYAAFWGEVDGFEYRNFFERTASGEVDTAKYWKTKKKHFGYTFFAVDIPSTVRGSKFKIKLYHGGVAGQYNNSDFSIWIGQGQSYSASYTDYQTKIYEITNNTENVTELEIDATSWSQNHYLNIRISKGRPTGEFEAILVGMDILTLAPAPVVVFDLDGGNINGDTGHIVAPALEQHITSAFVPEIPTKVGHHFKAWLIRGAEVAHSDLLTTIFNGERTDVKAIWE